MGIYSGALAKETIPLPGGETAVYNGSGLNFIRHADWLGSSRLATTWAHAVYSKEAYAPFGETYNEAGAPDRSFTGQDQDVVTGSGGTGVYDFLFRKYDPAAGRWLSPDPAGWGVVDQTTPQSMNRYAYVQNNPMSAVDAQGLDCISVGAPDDSSDCNDSGVTFNSNDYGTPVYEDAYAAPVLIPGSQRPQYANSNPCDGPYDTSTQCDLYWQNYQNLFCPGGQFCVTPNTQNQGGAPSNPKPKPTPKPTLPAKDWCQFYKTTINVDTDLLWLAGGGWAGASSSSSSLLKAAAPELAVVAGAIFVDRAISRYGGNWEHGCHN